MNSINQDLEFTTELESDFCNNRLPTLSFEVWSEPEGIRHSFFEKPMRSQILTMQRSAQSEKSKMSILVNELNRRFEVVDDLVDGDEKKEIVEHFTKQLVNSGYRYSQSREIVLSSLKGMLKKKERWLQQKKRFKSGAETLEERYRKKLLEPTSWYKDRKVEKDVNEDANELETNMNTWKKYRERGRKRKRVEGK